MAKAIEEVEMGDRVQALGGSVERLRTMSTDLSDAQLTTQAYPSEWTIADVLSHLGSGAVIMQRRLDDILSADTTPDDFAQGVWDEWNAKSPRQKADDALVSDRELLERVESLSAAQRAEVKVAMGPMTLDFEAFIGMRLNEHALHTWDVEVALDPHAKVPTEAASELIDNLGLIARFTGRPVGLTRDVRIHTTEPERDFTVSLTPDTVALDSGASGPPDLQLPAEAFSRLIYGRLDPDHTPDSAGDADALDALRKAFPGP